MNAQYVLKHLFPSKDADVPSARNRAQSRVPHRKRDFGIGYGNSSGYASTNCRRYADSWAKQPFSCW